MAAAGHAPPLATPVPHAVTEAGIGTMRHINALTARRT